MLFASGKLRFWRRKQKIAQNTFEMYEHEPQKNTKHSKLMNVDKKKEKK